ncbi:MAG: hypothetical protein COU67_00500 [Candidatus Pacebacteria bacterium CG10_big_fil_rev_8_21_14_0_10_44_54]|nr:MAG: hypothetical protein COU67_00500 [Candidatus Pacebacteria bacterium CG10_big_fil_rev_8_21_14_0_10_44_54]
MNKYKWLIAFLLLLTFIGILSFQENKAFVLVDSREIEVTNGAWCDNSDEAQSFEKPIPVVWRAQFDGCLVSCQGASFTKNTNDGKYPRFAGYYPDTKGNYDSDEFNPMPKKYQEEGLVLKVSGDWIGIEDDHSQTVFSGKCVPIVNIKQIEIVD